MIMHPRARRSPRFLQNPLLPFPFDAFPDQPFLLIPKEAFNMMFICQATKYLYPSYTSTNRLSTPCY